RATRCPTFTFAVTRYLIGKIVYSLRSLQLPISNYQLPNNSRLLGIGSWKLGVEFLWGEPLTNPSAAVLLYIAKPIVQAAEASLPEFEFVRDNAVAAPPIRPRHVTLAVSALRALEGFLEYVAALNGLTLTRGVDAQPAVQRTRRKVGIRFSWADAFDHTIDSYL